MKRKRTYVFLGGGVILLTAAFGFWKWHAQHAAMAQNQIVLYGNIDIRQVDLAFNDTERIRSIQVQEGDRVRAGELLGTLDPERYTAEVSNRTARVAAQRAVLKRLENGSRPEEIRKAKADMEAAEAAAHNAQLTFRRVKLLHNQGALPPQRLDDAQAALDAAQAQYQAAKEAYRLMVLGPRTEDIDAAKATLQANEAALNLACQELKDTRLYAPTNGVIENRILEPGDMASPQKPALTLALDNPVWVRAYLPETKLGKIRLGIKATVTTDSFPGRQYKGWIGFISPTAEFTPKSVETEEVRTKLVYQVRVFVNNPNGELRLGMPAVVTIPLNPRKAPPHQVP